MDIYKIEDMFRGWFIGNFEPTVFKTSEVEVGFKVHKKNEKYEMHYQTQVVEINLLISGKMKMHNKDLVSGDIFILYPYEVSDQEFIEDCEIVCIKIPGITNDKVVVDKKEGI